jgi:NitT/TauT family transport system permease protein
MLLLRAPAALPYFFTGLRIAAILAPIGALTADYLVGTSSGSRSGLGITALLFSARNEIAALYATAIVGCVLGFALVAAVSALSWLVLHRWHDSYSPDESAP